MVKNNIDGIPPEIKSLQERIIEDRQKFKKLVNDSYAQNNPFPGRPDSKEGFRDDIVKFWELIAYSLIAGDTEILDRWAINPLIDGKLSLSQPNQPQYYLSEFTEDKDVINMNNKLGKALVEQLAKALKKRL